MAHYILIRKFELFGARWIGRRPAPHLWPPRSPDLKPLDFFFWEALKAFVYRSGIAVRTAENLRQRINEGIARLTRNETILARVRFNLKARLRACLWNRGNVEAGEQARMLRAIGMNETVLWVPRKRRRQNAAHD